MLIETWRVLLVHVYVLLATISLFVTPSLKQKGAFRSPAHAVTTFWPSPLATQSKTVAMYVLQLFVNFTNDVLFFTPLSTV